MLLNFMFFMFNLIYFNKYTENPPAKRVKISTTVRKTRKPTSPRRLRSNDCGTHAPKSIVELAKG